MDQKKRIIIQEIDYWRKSQLLPAHYCQFLLNLYQEGENLETTPILREKKSFPWRKSLFTFILTLILSVLIFFAINFHNFISPIQGLILSITTIALYGITIWLNKREFLLFHILMGISSIALLFTLAWIGININMGLHFLIFFLIIAIFIWLLSGIFFKLNYLISISLIGLLISYGWGIYPWISKINSIWLQQAVWLPIIVLGMVGGFYLQNHTKMNRKIIYFIGSIPFFGSEIYSFILNHKIILVFQILFLKVFLTIALFFNLKNGWIRTLIKKMKK